MTDNKSPQNDGSQGGLEHVSKEGGLNKANVKEMEIYDIIEHDIKKFNLNMDPETTYSAIAHMVKQPQYRLIRANNTVLFMDNKGNGTADGLIFTADGPQTFVKTLMQLEKALVVAGIQTMTFPSSGIAIEPLLKRAKINYTAKSVDLETGKGQIITVNAK
jgi:hypothetical protein